MIRRSPAASPLARRASDAFGRRRFAVLSALGARVLINAVNRRPPKPFRRRERNRALRLVLACAAACAAAPSHAALPGDLARAFREAHIPSSAVAVFVQQVGEKQPVLAHQAAKPMNPASTMKLVTTFAALELLGADYRWKTEAYADGPVVDGALDGNLVLKGYGDPKITIEQFQSLVAALRGTGLATIRGDLVLDRSYFAPPVRRPGAFDAEPLKPYNVAPDALLLNFNSVRFVFAPDVALGAVAMRAEPPLANVVFSDALQLVPGECGDWRAGLKASIASRVDRAQARFSGRYPAACGERDWYFALLDHRHYAQAMFAHYWKEAGGSFAGGLRDGRAPAGATPLATLESTPLYDAIRDINKLSNNVMAQQLFLTLATSAYPPPATAPRARAAVRRWLAGRGLRFPELVLENGSGLSRRERISAKSMGALLLAADASAVRADYESSLAVAATDGTMRKRFLDDDVADRALLKTGTLEGVRALAGYVLGHGGRRYVVVCFVNHPNAAHAQRALDLLVEDVYAGNFDARAR
ncbi:MAG TPA: D-alanyl-D-alanine carboxypeptidase/D-alanyl-D-alanine-endopeptidase [Casimicrobiaceae bacterium]|nr:D-alanyl-D-alanine carboxypeptidase/D-alanyl-D-alanine-endopeptidase [Casimicrobiaceae bacterium]